MTLWLEPARVRALVVDIEGTTTPIEFVYEVLFPYARRQLREFLAAHGASPEVGADLALLRAEHARDVQGGLKPPAWQADSLESVVAYIEWLMHRDRKATGLKSLQGKIWEGGYRSGALRSRLYPDVPVAFARWQQQKKTIAIFSSGSVLAQKLLFAHTDVGDLTRFIDAYFDTSTGAKTEPESYRRIAAALGIPAPEILFVSDALAELEAARLAGLETAFCLRPGAAAQASTHPIIHSFDEIFP